MMDESIDSRWDEGRSFWLAILIALGPIPASLLISWSLGAPPPWRSRTPTQGAAAGPSPATPGHAGHR